MTQTINIGTLFSGIGAPEVAINQLGIPHNVVFGCEIDKFARQTYMLNHKIQEEDFHTDITNTCFKKYHGKVDIVVGGSPCQSFSIAGKKLGLEDPRGNLMFEYIRAISEVKPKIFIFENVKMFLKNDNGKTLKMFLDKFDNLGYKVKYQVVNTKDYGVPQSRQRVYAVGFLDQKDYDKFQFPPKIPLEKKLIDLLETEVDEKYNLKEASKKLVMFHKYDQGRRFRSSETREVSKTILTNPTRQDNDFIDVVAMLDIKGRDSVKRIYNAEGVSPTLTTMQGGNRVPKIVQRPRGYNQGNLFEDVSPTLSSHSWERNNVLWQDRVIRRLTPRECLRLQGFPEDFKYNVSDTQAYKQAGNAMSVNVLEHIFKSLLKN